MLRIRIDTEDWREQIVGWGDVDAIEAAGECAIDDAADQLCEAVLDRLDEAGIEYKRAPKQSIGTFEILQSGGSAADRNSLERILVEEIEGVLADCGLNPPE